MDNISSFDLTLKEKAKAVRQDAVARAREGIPDGSLHHKTEAVGACSEAQLVRTASHDLVPGEKFFFLLVS